MQQLPNGQFRITNKQTGQTKDVSAADLPQYGLIAPLNQQQGNTPTTPSQGPSINFADVLPGLLGTAGAVGGGVLGTAVEPGGGTIAGGVAGGAAGQGLGETLKDIIEGKKVDPGDVAKSAATGGIFGAVPGGEGAEIGERILMRLIAGGVAGGANEAIQEFNPNKPDLGENAGKIAESGAITGGVNTALGGGFDAAGFLTKLVGKDLPGAINKAIDQDQTEIGGQLVGAKNLATAKAEGILPPTIDKININDLQGYKQKQLQAADATEKQLQAALTSSSAKTTTYKDIRNQVQDLFDKAAPYESVQLVKPTSMDEDSQSLIRSMLQSPNKSVRLQAIDMMKQQGESDAFLSKFLPKVDAQGNKIDFLKNPDTVLTASQINDVKRGIARFYSKNGLAKELYQSMRQKVEDLSGNNEQVVSLNKKAHALTEIGDMLDKHIDRESDLPQKFTEGQNARIQNQPTLKTAKAAVNAGTSLAGYMTPARFIGYIAARGFEPGLDKSIFNKSTADFLENKLGKLPTNQKVQALQRIMQMIGLEASTARPQQ